MWTPIIIILLIAGSALFSGLTIGLMKLNIHELERKAKLGNENAKKIYPLRKQGNVLLVTLLLGNVAVNTAISIVLRNVSSGLVAGVVATIVIVLFGEILPMAAFNRHAMNLSARLAPFIHVCLIVLYPVSKPIAFLLDKTFGHEKPLPYTQRELLLLMREQSKHDREEGEQDAIDYALQGLSLSNKTVRSVMKPRNKVFMLDASKKISSKLLEKLKRNPYSRIPVYEENRDRIIGLLYTKDLALQPVILGETVRSFVRQGVRVAHENDKLDATLRKFKRLKQHLFVVHNAKHKITGIITLEDVVEEITGDINDEHDE